MYEDPEWYSRYSDDHKHETKWAMSLFWEQMAWRPCDLVLDVGCGSGDALVTVIKPLLPKDTKLVGVDMSPSMIDFAKSKWHDSQVSFSVLDIATQNDPLSYFDADIQKAGLFDKVLSFFCLQWVKDRRRMMSNLHRLLLPGGLGFFLVVVRNGLYNVWDKIASHEEWRPYLQEMKTPLNDYIYMDNYEEVFCNAAEEAGFQVLAQKVVERKDAFITVPDTDQEKINRLRTVDPFLRCIPESRKLEYLQHVLEVLKREVSPRGATDYTALIVLVKKKE